MTALTDAEILTALPPETRQKIDSALEALAQSLPSDKERAILYRVAHTLKLSPTDTVFSIMAALNYYLQLYQMIPGKIVNAGGEVIKAGQTVDGLIRAATKETLTEHRKTLVDQAKLVSAQTEKHLSALVSESVEKIAATEASGRYWKGVGVGLLGAAFLAAVCGIGGWWVAKSQYEKTVAESAAWVNSPSGQLVISCSDPTWTKEKRDGGWVCSPNGNVHGWHLP